MENQLAIQRLSGALATEEFERVCQEHSLTPLEITDHYVIQTITIRHNVMTGRFEWKIEKIGEQAIGVLADVMADMWRYFFKEPLRPKLTSGHARVMVDLNGDSLKIIYGLTDPNNPHLSPIPDTPVAKAMLVAALFGLCDKTNQDGFDPLQALAGIKFNKL